MSSAELRDRLAWISTERNWPNQTLIDRLFDEQRVASDRRSPARREVAASEFRKVKSDLTPSCGDRSRSHLDRLIPNLGSSADPISAEVFEGRKRTINGFALGCERIDDANGHLPAAAQMGPRSGEYGWRFLPN